MRVPFFLKTPITCLPWLKVSSRPFFLQSSFSLKSAGGFINSVSPCTKRKFNFIYHFQINKDCSLHFDGFASQYLYPFNFDDQIFRLEFFSLNSNDGTHFEYFILIEFWRFYLKRCFRNNLGCTFFMNLVAQTWKLPSWQLPAQS